MQPYFALAPEMTFDILSSKEGKRVRIENIEPINNPITIEDAKVLMSPSRAAL